jgi:hypothetical protein
VAPALNYTNQGVAYFTEILYIGYLDPGYLLATSPALVVKKPMLVAFSYIVLK